MLGKLHYRKYTLSNVGTHTRSNKTMSTATAPVMQPERDMCGIRESDTHTFVVRVSIGGVQEHVGTFRSYAAALGARNDRRGARLAVPRKLPVSKKVACKGVYERNSATGKVYDVVKYVKGYYLGGGRHRSRGEAEEAWRVLTVEPEMREAHSAFTSEPGISVRFNRGRRGSNQETKPVFVARSHKNGSKHLGTFPTMEQARQALKRAEEENEEKGASGGSGGSEALAA